LGSKIKIIPKLSSQINARSGILWAVPAGGVPGRAGEKASVIAFAKSFFRSGRPYNPPYPPLKKEGNCQESLLKSPFEKGGFRGI
jgi:hypothetical protein